MDKSKEVLTKLAYDLYVHPRDFYNIFYEFWIDNEDFLASSTIKKVDMLEIIFNSAPEDSNSTFLYQNIWDNIKRLPNVNNKVLRSIAGDNLPTKVLMETFLLGDTLVQGSLEGEEVAKNCPGEPVDGKNIAPEPKVSGPIPRPKSNIPYEDMMEARYQEILALYNENKELKKQITKMKHQLKSLSESWEPPKNREPAYTRTLPKGYLVYELKDGEFLMLDPAGDRVAVDAKSGKEAKEKAWFHFTKKGNCMPDGYKLNACGHNGQYWEWWNSSSNLSSRSFRNPHGAVADAWEHYE